MQAPAPAAPFPLQLTVLCLKVTPELLLSVQTPARAGRAGPGQLQFLLVEAWPEFLAPPCPTECLRRDFFLC